MSANAPAILRAKDESLPVREDLLRAMKIAENSPEAAQYLSQRVHQIVEKSRYLNKNPEAMKTAQEVIKAVDEFAQFVTFKFSQDAQIWSGQTPESSNFKNMQRGIAQQAIGALSDKNYPGIRFDFAINKEGHFVRGYASTEKGAPPLEEKTVESLDRLFNAWLADKHQVATEDGYFFKTDADGNKIGKLSVEEVENLLTDSAQEFKQYLEESKVPTQIVSRQREYPGEHRLEEAKKVAAKKAVERVIETAEVEEKVEPEAPTAPPQF